MSLTLPRLSDVVAERSVPVSHRLVTLPQRARLARRISGAAKGRGRGRWHPGLLRQACLQVPALPEQLRAQEPGSLATPRAVEHLRDWLRAAIAEGLLTDADQGALRGASPDAALALLRSVFQRQANALLAEVAEAAGAERLRHFHVATGLHVTPLLALHGSFSTGVEAHLDDACSLVLTGEDLGLVEWTLGATTEDRAIRGALDALSKALCVPTVLPCEHGAELAGGMYIEFATDAVRDAQCVDGQWLIEPEAVRNFCDELGFDDDTDVVERLQAFAEFKRREREASPLDPSSEVVQSWLTCNHSGGATLVRRLCALAALATKHSHRQKFQTEWEGSYGPVVGLCVAPDGFDDWIGESGSSFYEEDQRLTQKFDNPTQLLRVLPASIVAVAVANATCSLLVEYLNHGR